MIGITMTNAAPAIAPWGGAEAFMGTNPFSIGVPTFNENPLIADMSSSIVARGKIRAASRKKTPIPPGWALDENGEPTEDPDLALKGTLLPMGGPKGAALALIIDIFAGMLSGLQIRSRRQDLSRVGRRYRSRRLLHGDKGR